MFQIMWRLICFTFNLKHCKIKKKEAQRRGMQDFQESEAFWQCLLLWTWREVAHDCLGLCSEVLEQPWEVLLKWFKKQTNQTKIILPKPQQKNNWTTALPQAQSKSRGQCYVKAPAANQHDIRCWTYFAVYGRGLCTKTAGQLLSWRSPQVLHGMRVACCSKRGLAHDRYPEELLHVI